MADLWYCGNVTITLKEAALEPSSPFRHAAELFDLLKQESKPILFLYSDGGPDHRLANITYCTIQIYYLCAARTAPCQSWRNPVERVMSTVNMGMQCVDLMRRGSEAQVDKCDSLSDLRKAAMKYPNFREDTLDSISPVNILLSQRLKLKEKSFSV